MKRRKLGAWLLTGSACGIRGAFGLYLLRHGGLLGLLVGGSEFVAALVTLWNAGHAKAWRLDGLWWFQPLVYGSGLWIVPDGPGWGAASGVALLLLGFHWWCQWHCWDAMTIGVQTWSGRVRESGPYGAVRHPLELSVLAQRVALCVIWPSGWNVGVVAAGMVSAVVNLLVEERWLQRQASEYREYCRRVRYRLVPWIW